MNEHLQTAKTKKDPTESIQAPLLEIKDFSVSFVQYVGGLRQKNLKVITSLDVTVMQGEVLAIVGSSGSGKSLLAHAILGILPRNAQVSGTITYKGESLTTSLQEELRGREIAFIPQSVNYLDPLMWVGLQVRHAVKGKDKAAAVRRAFNRFHLDEQAEKLYPFQLSGGMARRVLVSSAVVSGATLVIADEPTPGLHSKVVQETLSHLRQLADEGCAVILITHDITAALTVADRIAVFYAGSTVETAPASDFCGKGETLRHPYSKALWRALPQNEFMPIAGFQPLPGALPPGCLFEPRCPNATRECSTARPEIQNVRNGMVRCIHAT